MAVNLGKYKSSTPSRWKDEAIFRKQNKRWLGYSQQIAMAMLDKMEACSMTQTQLADKLGCSQQYVSRVLKGSENLSLETICKIEDALDLSFFTNPNHVHTKILKAGKAKK